MIIKATSKINIGLFIKKKRDDGYHDIETVFYNLPDYHDILEIVPASGDKDEFEFFGKEILGELKDNLIYKALVLVREKYPQANVPLKIVLLKNLPMGAGLGGGSSNGSHMLTALNDYFNLKISVAELEDMSLTLGSDCPFFIEKITCVAEGRGEIFTPVNVDLSDYSIQLVTPDIHISTAMAFHKLDIQEHQFSLHDIESLPLAEWKNVVVNDFEKTIFNMFPEIQDIKEQMYEAGALYASLSGTGSSVYGIFPKNKKATVESTVAFQEFYCE